MKISTKGRYAIHILYDLAVNGTEHPVSVKEMATRQEISVKYTEQIISILNKAGYVSSSRGFQGGYRLAKAPDQYTAEDILLLTEGSLCPVACVDQPTVECERSANCPTRPLWQGLNRVIHEYLSSITLQDLLDQQTSQYGNDYMI